MIYDEIYTHATAEFLAKKDDYAADGLDYYLDQATRYMRGDTNVVPEGLHASIAIQGLMLYDREGEVRELYPESEQTYVDTDALQLRLAHSFRNLDYFTEHGVDYEFDESQAEYAASLVKSDRPVSVSLMRERIVRASGFNNVRVNYIYHDVMDHVWLFQFMRDKGIADKYEDYVQAIGNPFQGSLISRESELFSGIGFVSRRYLSSPDYYGSLALQPDDIAQLLSISTYSQDDRITNVISVIRNNIEITKWSGYVIKAAVANLMSQREKWGAPKELVRDESGNYISTGKTVPLLDARYLALIVDTVSGLAANKDEYIDAQQRLNHILERIITQYLKNGKATGSISLKHSVSEDAKQVGSNVDDIGISTNYF